jgi:hypothetical protein
MLLELDAWKCITFDLSHVDFAISRFTMSLLGADYTFLII